MRTWTKRRGQRRPIPSPRWATASEANERALSQEAALRSPPPPLKASPASSSKTGKRVRKAQSTAWAAATTNDEDEQDEEEREGGGASSHSKRQRVDVSTLAPAQIVDMTGEEEVPASAPGPLPWSFDPQEVLQRLQSRRMHATE